MKILKSDMVIILKQNDIEITEDILNILDNIEKYNNEGLQIKTNLEFCEETAFAHIMIPNDEYHRRLTLIIGNTLIKPDGYDESAKTIYEFYGDYWHGNPNIYKSNELNKTVNKTFGELYLKTIERENFLKSNGYNIISIWESEWKKINEQILTNSGISK